MAYALNFVDRTIVGVVQQPMKADLGLSDTALGLIGGTAFALFYSILGLPIARLAERQSRRSIIAVAIACWSVMTMACGAAGSFGQLFLCRIGVGIGEAGGTPASHAVIADLYAPDQRARPIAIYSLGVPMGVLLGALGGGLLAQRVGWRWSFIVAGLPGLLLAPAIRLLVAEPPRSRRPARPADFVTIVSHLLSLPSFIHLAAGIVIASTAGYALLAFLPSLLARQFGFSLGAAGLATGLVSGAAAGVGTLLGGVLADRFGTRKQGHAALVPAIGLIIACPLFTLACAIVNAPLALALLALASVAQFSYLGPTYSLTQNLVPADMRATTSALLLLLVNLIGLGLGPPMLGALSDQARSLGISGEPLSFAMSVFASLFAWGAFHYWRAARFLADDLRCVSRNGDAGLGVSDRAQYAASVAFDNDDAHDD